jgi:hypothetical protein
MLSRARCDEQRILDSAASWAAGHLAAGQHDGDGVLIVDETADAKSSADCARPASTAAPSAASPCARSRSPSPTRPRPGTL